MLEITRLSPKDHLKLIDLIKHEGVEWIDYYDENRKDMYLANCEANMTYLLFKDAELVAYIRAIEDIGYAIYICDLLVDQHHRGHGFGKMLIEHIKSLYPKYEIYVMSDVDPYYIKQGYKKIGSIFEI